MEKERRTSIFENGLIWFGAGVSLAEILTGTYFAPLGFAAGLSAILVRTSYRMHHVIPCGTDRRKSKKKRYGNSKNELWTEGKPFICIS